MKKDDNIRIRDKSSLNVKQPLLPSHYMMAVFGPSFAADYTVSGLKRRVMSCEQRKTSVFKLQ